MEKYHPKAYQQMVEQEQRTEQRAEEKRKERIETRRFWLTFSVALIAALAGIGSIVLQLLQSW